MQSTQIGKETKMATQKWEYAIKTKRGYVLFCSYSNGDSTKPVAIFVYNNPGVPEISMYEFGMLKPNQYAHKAVRNALNRQREKRFKKVQPTTDLGELALKKFGQ